MSEKNAPDFPNQLGKTQVQSPPTLDIEELARIQQEHERQVAQAAEDLAEKKRLEEAEAANTKLALEEYTALSGERWTIQRTIEKSGLDRNRYEKLMESVTSLEEAVATAAEQAGSYRERLASDKEDLTKIQALVSGKSMAPEVEAAITAVQNKVAEAEKGVATAAAEEDRLAALLEDSRRQASQNGPLFSRLSDAEKKIDELYGNEQILKAIVSEAEGEHTLRERLINQASEQLNRLGSIHERQELKGVERERFVKRALQMFVSEDMDHRGISSMADYDAEGILMGLRSSGVRHTEWFEALANGFADFPDSEAKNLRAHARGIKAACMLRSAFQSGNAGTSDYFVRDLAQIDNAGYIQRDNLGHGIPQPVSEGRQVLMDYMGFLNTIKAAEEGCAVPGTGEEMHLIFNGKRRLWEGGDGILDKYGLTTRPGEAVMPREWTTSVANEKADRARKAYANELEHIQREVESELQRRKDELLRELAESVRTISSLEQEQKQVRRIDSDILALPDDGKQDELRGHSKLHAKIRYQEDLNKLIDEIAAIRINLPNKEGEIKEREAEFEKYGHASFIQRRNQAKRIAVLESEIREAKDRMEAAEAEQKDVEAILKQLATHGERSLGKIAWELTVARQKLSKQEEALRRLGIEPTEQTLVKMG